VIEETIRGEKILQIVLGDPYAQVT